MVINHLLAIIVKFPLLVYLASYWNTLYAQTSWPTLMNINFCQTNNKHSGSGIELCKTQLATMINDWAKILDNKGQVDTFILDFEKAFNTPHMNSFRVNCLVMELVVKH